jgi:hypothetical protein
MEYAQRLYVKFTREGCSHDEPHGAAVGRDLSRVSFIQVSRSVANETAMNACTSPSRASVGLQQSAAAGALREFNAERPHEALDMKCPVEFYTASPRPFGGLPELT